MTGHNLRSKEYVTKGLLDYSDTKVSEKGDTLNPLNIPARDVHTKPYNVATWDSLA